MHPLAFGDYPEEVKATKPVPEFTEEQRQLLMDNKPDFLGINTYTTKWVHKLIAVRWRMGPAGGPFIHSTEWGQ